MEDQKPRELISIMMGKDVPFIEKSAYDQLREQYESSIRQRMRFCERIAKLEAALAIADELIGIDEVNDPRGQWERARAALENK